MNSPAARSRETENKTPGWMALAAITTASLMVVRPRSAC